MARIARNPFENSIPSVLNEPTGFDDTGRGDDQHGEHDSASTPQVVSVRKKRSDGPNEIICPKSEAPNAAGRRFTSNLKVEREATPLPGQEALSTESGRERGSVYMTPALWNRIRNAAYWRRETLTEIFERCMNEGIDKLEAENGHEFRQRRARLRTGRPMK